MKHTLPFFSVVIFFVGILIVINPLSASAQGDACIQDTTGTCKTQCGELAYTQSGLCYSNSSCTLDCKTQSKCNMDTTCTESCGQTAYGSGDGRCFSEDTCTYQLNFCSKSGGGTGSGTGGTGSGTGGTGTGAGSGTGGTGTPGSSCTQSTSCTQRCGKGTIEYSNGTDCFTDAQCHNMDRSPLCTGPCEVSTACTQSCKSSGTDYSNGVDCYTDNACHYIDRSTTCSVGGGGGATGGPGDTTGGGAGSGTGTNGTTGSTGAPGTGSTNPARIMLPNPLGISSVEDLLSRILRFLLYLATPIAVIMIMWSAYLFLFSGGDTKKVETAKQTFWYVVIGYAILLLAQGVTSIIKSFLGA